MKLDKKIEPLAVDTQLRVRPRSALGLKYVELSPARARATLRSGDTIPVANTSEPLEFEDLFSTLRPRDARRLQAATRASATPSPAGASRSTARSRRSTRSSAR